MTTRFSLSELSDMLGVPVEVVRTAVETLYQEQGLTAETFVFGERSWRVSPSDVKRLQKWIESDIGSGQLSAVSSKRRIRRKQKLSGDESTTST